MSFSDLPGRLAEVLGRIDDAVGRGGFAQQVRVVAVTKTHGPEAVRAAWEAGVRDVGENRVQEALAKMEEASVPVAWHMIGHLQRNKVQAMDRFALVESVDSARLAEALSAHGVERGRAVDVLVQVNVSGERSKGGFSPAELPAEAERFTRRPGVRVSGVMTMAPLGASEAVLRTIFGEARSARAVLAAAGHPASDLSMGMSSDYEIAVEEGATMVRLGTILFGARHA